jgi:hypothetical protein
VKLVNRERNIGLDPFIRVCVLSGDRLIDLRSFYRSTDRPSVLKGTMAIFPEGPA